MMEHTPSFKRTRGMVLAVWAEKGLICMQHLSGFRVVADALAKTLLIPCHKHLKISTLARSGFIIAMRTS